MMTTPPRSLDRFTKHFSAHSYPQTPCPPRISTLAERGRCLLHKLDFIERFEKQEIDPNHYADTDHVRDEALAAYRGAASDLEEMMSNVLPALRTTFRARPPHAFAQQFDKVVHEIGKVDVVEVLRQSIHDERLRNSSDTTEVFKVLDRVLDRLVRHELTATAESGRVVWSASIEGRSSTFTIRPPKAASERTIADLLHGSDLDWLLGAAAGGTRPLLLFGGAHEKRDAGHSAEDLVTSSIFLPRHLLHRRIRSFEDIGIPAYRGADFGLSILIGILVGVAIAGAILFGVGSALHADGCAETGGDCTLPDWLMAIGAVAFILGGWIGCEASPECEVLFSTGSRRDPSDPDRI